MVNMMPSEVCKVDVSGISQAKVDWSPDSLFTRVYSDNTARSATNNAPESQSNYISTGQIELMKVPTDWVKRDNVNLKANDGLVEYHPADNHDVRLNSSFRGNRISEDAAKAFTNCLKAVEHSIAKGSEELKSLAEVIDDKSRNFNISKAFTEDLNGKRVLVVEGAYKDTEHTTTQTRYVDSDGTGSAVQEISYTAPGALFNAHLPAAEKAIKSILWK